MRTTLLLLLLASAPALFAQNALQGKDAPAFNANDCINAPEQTTFDQCKGEVVLIKFWGIN
jgi:hypothetical protein